ncbi:hypothetical protein SERLA73DRAFT_154348 [Serpula lacrymans var. lacrymans S7.3]|uniref:Uncharacterized protein n=1 Tax=Serpula lacrymans var. lacrymans (strain S7.3) TaxID=936435 RepID=F8Q4B8_SERL3|nr:hypothetical protein SERLA73DRAFT_154348 [Serpula lacrymans var. lacrymans S7.3]
MENNGCFGRDRVYPVLSPNSPQHNSIPHNVDTSTIFPEIQFTDTDDAFLQPVVVTICFPGVLSRHLVDGGIAIQFSVTLAEEYKSLATPVVQVVSWNYFGSEQSLHSGDTCFIDNDCKSSSPFADILVNFLPLSHLFNHLRSHHWFLLSRQIQEWLVTIPKESQHWSWGRNAFWLAFIGANPYFPNGSWSKWDPRILLQGLFFPHAVVSST